MALQWERTCWRGIQVDHPVQWETAVASGLEDPGRLTFADRLYHRLDLRWWPLKYVPNMELLLAKYKQRSGDDLAEIQDLKTAPAPWTGVIHKTPDATIVHAGRFFRQVRLMVEATIVWPDGRDLGMESRILESIQAAEPNAAVRLWQAMGMSVSCPGDFELQEASLKVGQIQWCFAAKANRGLQLTVERIAMPGQWLKGRALRDWLAQQLPAGSRQLQQHNVSRGRHSAEQILSVSKAPLAARLRGLRHYQLDLAWRCNIEDRVYHVRYGELGRYEQIAPPSGLEVRCCRAVPSIEQSQGAV